MLRKSLAILLVFFWVTLSALDLLEDLKFGSGGRAYKQSPNDKSSPYLNHRASLANNIVETADRAQLSYASLLRLTAVQSPVHPLLSFRKVFPLHKLHRVFLI